MVTDLEQYWQAYCKGDKSAFDKVFTSLIVSLFFKVMTLTDDRDVAKDIAQEALIRLYQCPDPSSIRDINKWTFSVAKNLFINEYRKLQTHKKYQKHLLDENQYIEAAATSFPDEDNFINLARKNLSSGDFQLLQLDMQGYPIPEIATKLKMQQKTVYNRRTNVRKVITQLWNQVFVLLIVFYL